MFFLITADSQWFTVIYTPQGDLRMQFCNEKAIGISTEYAKFKRYFKFICQTLCIFNLREGEGVGWLVWCPSLLFCAGSSGKVRLKYERENLATIISANRWSFRRRVIYIDEKCLKLKLKLKSLPLFTVSHRRSWRRSWRRSRKRSSCCH